MNYPLSIFQSLLNNLLNSLSISLIRVTTKLLYQQHVIIIITTTTTTIIIIIIIIVLVLFCAYNAAVHLLVRVVASSASVCRELEESSLPRYLRVPLASIFNHFVQYWSTHAQTIYVYS